MQIEGPKAANHNRYQRIIRAGREMGPGLKILVSLLWSAAARSRPEVPSVARLVGRHPRETTQ
jgi:hypothetical protein